MKKFVSLLIILSLLIPQYGVSRSLFDSEGESFWGPVGTILAAVAIGSYVTELFSGPGGGWRSESPRYSSYDDLSERSKEEATTAPDRYREAVRLMKDLEKGFDTKLIAEIKKSLKAREFTKTLSAEFFKIIISDIIIKTVSSQPSILDKRFSGQFSKKAKHDIIRRLKDLLFQRAIASFDVVFSQRATQVARAAPKFWEIIFTHNIAKFGESIESLKTYEVSAAQDIAKDKVNSYIAQYEGHFPKRMLKTLGRAALLSGAIVTAGVFLNGIDLVNFVGALDITGSHEVSEILHQSYEYVRPVSEISSQKINEILGLAKVTYRVTSQTLASGVFLGSVIAALHAITNSLLHQKNVLMGELRYRIFKNSKAASKFYWDQERKEKVWGFEERRKWPSNVRCEGLWAF